jgi:hypothetical protein
MYLLIHIILDLLPRTVMLVCTFQMSVALSLVKVLLFCARIKKVS